jgi:hypothetical protein
MSLAIYYKDDNDQFVLVSDTFPISTIHNGRTGDVKTTQLFIRNDDDTKWFSNIVIKPVDLVDANPYGDVGYTETGWGVKLNYSESEPSNGEWLDLSWGEAISISAIGSNLAADKNYKSFWYYITCPPNEDVKIKTDIVLEVSFTENVVGA